MWCVKVWCIRGHKSNIIFKNSKLDIEEVFTLAQPCHRGGSLSSVKLDWILASIVMHLEYFFYI